MQRLTAELKVVHTIGWNSERPLDFMAVILPMKDNIMHSKDICVHIEQHMEIWERIRFSALVDDTVNEGWGGRGGSAQGSSTTTQEENSAQAYNHTLLYV